MTDANNLQENLAKIDHTYYDQFINYLRNKPIKLNIKTNKHRILQRIQVMLVELMILKML